MHAAGSTTYDLSLLFVLVLPFLFLPPLPLFTATPWSLPLGVGSSPTVLIPISPQWEYSCE